MKKIIRGICILFFISCILDLGSDVFAQSSNLGKIKMDFCNDNQKTNQIDTATKAGKKTPICIEFTNISDEKMTIDIEFVDAVITDDASRKRACNAPDRPKMQFANFIEDYTHTVTLQPGETVKNEYTVRFPIGFQGLSHGCMVYDIVGEQQSTNNFLGIIVRSAKFIDISVDNTDPITTTRISSLPKIMKRGDGYAVNLGIGNDGNIDEDIIIKGTITNILGYQKEFNIQGMISADTEKIFETDPFILPFYKGLFMITTEVSYKPKFNFDSTDGKSSLQNIQGGTLTGNKNVIVRNIRFIGMLAIPMITVGMIFRKRKKSQAITNGI